MMQFLYDGELYKITRPKHNMLGLSFIDNKVANDEIEIAALKMKHEDAKNISETNVKEQVISAIKEVNIRFGVNYRVKKEALCLLPWFWCVI